VLLSTFPTTTPYALAPYVIDWHISDPDSLLETRIYETSTAYDALNRPI